LKSNQSNNPATEPEVPTGQHLIALVGNPNAGKTTLFNSLTGSHQKVGNYAGVTVEKVSGYLKLDDEIVECIDVPGQYSLSAVSEDEKVAVDVIEGREKDTRRPDLLVCVLDATNLERNLYFFSQLAEAGHSVVVAMTMVDRLEQSGQAIDLPKMSNLLGVEIVPMVGHKDRGLQELKDAIWRNLRDPRTASFEIRFPDAIETRVAALRERVARVGIDFTKFDIRRALLHPDDPFNSFLKDFPEMQDVLRYVLCANAPEAKDNDFTWKDFQDRNNSELVNIFGNYVNRTFVLMHKLCKGRVPQLHQELMDDADHALIQAIQNAKTMVESAIENYKFRDALFEVVDLARKANKYMQDKEPWIVAKRMDTDATAQSLIDNCIHLCLQLTANLAILIQPFMPETAKRLCTQMKVVDRMLQWENAGRLDLLKVGYPLPAPQLLFRKVEDAEVTAQVEKLQNNLKAATMNTTPAPHTEATPAAPALPELKPEVAYDDFAKIDLRVATILKAEKVEKADKLLKLELQMGEEMRTVVSGIAMHYQPEAIVGRQVIVVANLAPRKMRGIESKGMILMAQNADGKLIFAAPTEAADNGGEVK